MLQEESTSTFLASEAATLSYLRDKSDIPVPEVFSFCPTHQNDIGVPYILMSKAHAKPLASSGWDNNVDLDEGA
ncbi:hypothetical protein DTO006G1_8022 [Penicillium roqueforti]|uniref:uncharacterized protein n=1 Tax=Penicillium roqueforti TaxID=5082 RepID=UPI00190BC994|nr:uncharacterized protein LCP9604111_4783 [Penicillium roqueforti]KAF9249067.1 hypothetical protein LCP9604111_4783 [Penicillium roqueforti]KAI1832109.1 hypothetical protein CBS147337_7181 [Penicillium roqueforti]KAI2673390.1 hypothetical protein CBS147355_7689 [Penicillium roqueforti]KAI2677486.1 hypothetical protein LCP963914a_8144 [Penicillium roqueforti]KAI2713862.1 hypothetical protein CBS147318_7140 [Penicillium roqueforti]